MRTLVLAYTPNSCKPGVGHFPMAAVVVPVSLHLCQHITLLFVYYFPQSNGEILLFPFYLNLSAPEFHGSNPRLPGVYS